MKFRYRYILEKHKNGKQKYICPQCGKRKFVRYIDNLTNKYVADHVGMCDRRESCKYHVHPYEYLKDNAGNSNYNRILKNYMNGKNKTNTSQIKTVDSISFDYAEKFSKRNQNNLNNYLYSVFGMEKVSRVNRDYFVGSTKNRITIFPLIDANGILRSAKFMQYNDETGRRLKDVSNAFNWLHSVLIKKKLLPEIFILRACLFGEHLIGLEDNSHKIICIVESEKTAIIASICIPDCIFMATG